MKWFEKNYDFWAITLLLTALIAWSFLSSCSRVIYVKECERVLDDVWKCKQQ